MIKFINVMLPPKPESQAADFFALPRSPTSFDILLVFFYMCELVTGVFLDPFDSSVLTGPSAPVLAPQTHGSESSSLE